MAFYCKTLPVHCSSGEYAEKRKIFVTFSINVEQGQNSLSNQQVVCKFTKDDDPLFLHILRITEDDFKCLKMQHKLHIDFANFKDKFVQFLETALKEDEKPNPKLLLYFLESCTVSNSESVLLEIVNIDSFKTNGVLSLKLFRANDKELLKHLSDTIISLKKNNHNLGNHLKSVELELKQKLQEKDLQLTKEKNDSDLLIQQHELSLAKSREDFERTKRSLEEKLNETQSETKKLTEDKDLYKRNVLKLKEENKNMKKDLDFYKRDLDEAESRINQLSTQLSVLEESFQEKNDHYQALLEQKRKLEDVAQQRHHELNKQKEDANTAKRFVKKCQADLEHYKTALEKCQHKSQTRALICVEIEKRLKAKECDVQRLQNDLDSLCKLTDENKILVEKLHDSEKSLNDNCKELDKKNAIIDHLYKQLNESHLRPIAAPPLPYGASKSLSSLNYKPVLGHLKM